MRVGDRYKFDWPYGHPAGASSPDDQSRTIFVGDVCTLLTTTHPNGRNDTVAGCRFDRHPDLVLLVAHDYLIPCDAVAYKRSPPLVLEIT